MFPSRFDRSRRGCSSSLVARMSQARSSLSTRISSYLTRLRHIPTTHRRKKKDTVVVQTSLSTGTFMSITHPRRADRGVIAPFLSSLIHLPSTVFQLPYEIFQEIFYYLPVLPWTEVYCRYLHDDRGHQPLPWEFWIRTKTLLALGATCRLMRQATLADAWVDYSMCRVWYNTPQIETKFVSRCEILLENPHLVTYVRYSTFICVPVISRY